MSSFNDASSTSTDEVPPQSSTTPPTSCQTSASSNERELRRNLHKKGLLSVCGTWGFLTGMERSVIIPTLWLYLKYKMREARHSSHNLSLLYGMSMGAFNLAVFLSTPVFGWLAVRGFKSRPLCVLSNLLEICGNLLYMCAAPHAWLVIAGRFVAGLGGGVEISMLADTVRVTSRDERTNFILMLLFTRQLGLIIGPATTLLFHNLQEINWTSTLSFSVLNAPGLLMALLYMGHTLMVLGLYPNISKQQQYEHNADVTLGSAEKDGSHVKQSRMKRIWRWIKNEIWEAPDHSPLRDSGQPDKDSEHECILGVAEQRADKACVNNTATSHDSGNSGSTVRNKRTCNAWSRGLSRFQRFLNFPTLSSLFFVFNSYYFMTSLETLLPAYMNKRFDWTEWEISFVYLAAGIEVILVMAVMFWLSKYWRDRNFLLVSQVILTPTYVLLTIVSHVASPQHDKFVWFGLILFAVFVHVIGIAMLCGPGESIFTKFACEADEDLGQLIVRIVANFSYFLGPLIAGFLVDMAALAFSIHVMLVVLGLLLILSRYSQFQI